MSQAPDVQSRQTYRVVGTGDFVWQSIVALITIEIAFAAGIFLHASFGYHRFQGEMTVAFVTMATLCLGFGIGILVSWRNRASDNEALRRKFELLREHADLLVQWLKNWNARKTGLSRGCRSGGSATSFRQRTCLFCPEPESTDRNIRDTTGARFGSSSQDPETSPWCSADMRRSDFGYA